MLEDIFQSPTSLSLFGVTIALLLFHFLHSNFSSQETQHPPGPRGLPLIGNLFQMDLKRLDQSLFDLSKKYGPVFQVYFGPQKVVVLAGYRTVKQALVNHAEEFGNRETNPLFYDLNQDYGIVFSNGETWKEMRRFALKTLKDFGMGRKISEEIIINECHYLIKEFEQCEGKAFNNIQAINYATSNVISTLMFGKRFEYTDQIFQAMVRRDNETIHLMGSASLMIYNLFPRLGPFLKNWRNVMQNVNDNKAHLRRIVANRKESLDPGICKCFIDAFLIRKKHLEDSGIKDCHYLDENLLYSVMNLFSAGTDTTANTLKWCLLYMAKFPQTQDQVHEELSRVVGSRQVRIEDRKNLPYTDAVVHEAQRLANIVPLALPHATSRDMILQGYFINEVSRTPLHGKCRCHVKKGMSADPQIHVCSGKSGAISCITGTTVFPLLTSVLYDESEWESPHSFNPSHFLDKEGKFIRRDAFMPFSAGRRTCLGESLAKMEIFLFVSSLIQHFCISAPPGVSADELDLKPVVGLILAPKPQELCAVRRF